MHSDLNDLGADGGGLANLYSDASVMAGMGPWACDLRTGKLSWTPPVFDMFGLPSNKRVDRRDTVSMYAEPHRFVLERLRSAAIANCGTFSLEAQILRPDGAERWIRVKAATKVQNGRAVTLYGMKEDITLERQRWEQLRHSIEYDRLTGLGNRAQFNARFLDHAPGSEALNPLAALALINLDNLGEINRRWGLAAGDACLMAFARRLMAACPDGAFAARLGSREFAMLLKSEVPVGTPGTGNQFSSLAEPVLWNETLIPIQVSVGTVHIRQSRKFEAEALYRQATAALAMARRKEERSLRLVVVTFNDGECLASDLAVSVANRADVANFRLSPREMEALRHLALGATTDEIARAMGVSRHTVRNFIRRMYEKMDVGGRVEAMRLALHHGML